MNNGCKSGRESLKDANKTCCDLEPGDGGTYKKTGCRDTVNMIFTMSNQIK